MNDNRPSLLELSVKTIVIHSVSYMTMGIIASSYLNYKELYALPWLVCWMRQFGDPLITAGPLFQPIRGLIFALAFYPLKEVLSERNMVGRFCGGCWSLSVFSQHLALLPDRLKVWCTRPFLLSIRCELIWKLCRKPCCSLLVCATG